MKRFSSKTGTAVGLLILLSVLALLNWPSDQHAAPNPKSESAPERDPQRPIIPSATSPRPSTAPVSEEVGVQLISSLKEHEPPNVGRTNPLVAALRREIRRERNFHARPWVERKLGELPPEPARDELLWFLISAMPERLFKDKISIALDFYSLANRKGVFIEQLFTDAGRLDPKWAFQRVVSLEKPSHLRIGIDATAAGLCNSTATWCESLQLLSSCLPAGLTEELIDKAFWRVKWQMKQDLIEPENVVDFLKTHFILLGPSQSDQSGFANALIPALAEQGIRHAIEVVSEFPAVSHNSEWHTWAGLADHVDATQPTEIQTLVNYAPKSHTGSGALDDALAGFISSTGREAVWDLLADVKPEKHSNLVRAIFRVEYRPKKELAAGIAWARLAIGDQSTLSLLQLIKKSQRPLTLTELERPVVEAAIANLSR